jgi:hypothetical protein
VNEIGYRYWRLRCIARRLPDEIFRRIAMRLPRRLAYFAFIRVHAASEADWPFDVVARQWKDGCGQ